MFKLVTKSSNTVPQKALVRQSSGFGSSDGVFARSFLRLASPSVLREESSREHFAFEPASFPNSILVQSVYDFVPDFLDCLTAVLDSCMAAVVRIDCSLN